MITALDTNIIIALWDRDMALNSAAQAALDRALAQGGLVVCAPVFTELLAAPGRTEAFVDSFFSDTGIDIEWEFTEDIWRTAGRSFQRYAARRRKQGDGGPRRILADFLIGAHAVERGYRLMTLDERLYRAAFPQITIARI